MFFIKPHDVQVIVIMTMAIFEIKDGAGITPKGITEIPDSAFSSQEWLELKSVMIPDTLTRIGDCAFFGCKNLETITLPSNNNRSWRPCRVL